MTQYLSPGVYVVEAPAAIRPIAGVGTSTAGFVGAVANNAVMPPRPGQFTTSEQGTPVPVRYQLAPANQPQLVTSWEAFKNLFGDFQAANVTLAHAVYGFFNNGGTRCWVTRLENLTNVAAVTGALGGLRGIDEIALLAVPGALDVNIQNAVIDQCENTGDRFAILDGQRAAAPTAANVQGNTRNSSYAGLYYPWLNVFDPVTNTNIFVPPSGHVAGIFARVDAQRGVHKAPANEIVRGAVGVELRLSRADQDGLNPGGINVIRAFDGNITVWGARTLGGNANNEWKYVNMRRLFMFLRESIDNGTRWVVFEPNDAGLWARITRNVSAFLTNVWRDGALFGATPAQAFYVKCDAQTNPPEVRAIGQVVIEIGVAMVTPAEFVIFRVSQWAGPGRG